MFIENKVFKLLCKYLTVIVFLLLTAPTWAQETVVVGQVLNQSTKIPIPYVNVYFKNSNQLTQTNEEGYFMIRYSGNETALVFSSVGYKTLEIKIKKGESVGVQIDLEEKNTILNEVLVLPGSNPANEWMRRIRLARSNNDVLRHKQFETQKTEQSLVLLSKTKNRFTNKRLYEQLRKGAIATVDSSLVVPLYMSETTYKLNGDTQTEVAKNTFSSPQAAERLLASLIGEVSLDLNFYQNAVVVFGRSIISPLANIGPAYYDYYLADSLQTKHGKQYLMHFRSKNYKNLAFNGKFRFDSASLALTEIDAELPSKANINFINNLHIQQNFEPYADKLWMRSNEQMELNLNYQILVDTLQPASGILLRRSSVFQANDSLIHSNTNNFAQSQYSQVSLGEKLNALGNTPLMRTARWIADVILTGSFQFGKIDVGKILDIARLTETEGLRLSLPFRTNERLWPNVSIGGAAGYGFRNHFVNHSALAQFKLPGEKKRVVGINYNNDYRRIDYNYNDFMYRENPLVTGDEDISSTLFILWSATKLNRREELTFSFQNDWNSDFESSLYLRSNRYFSNNVQPMISDGIAHRTLSVQSATLHSRLSFDERCYEDHLQRIYIANSRPVFTATFEAGKYKVGNKSGNYGKIMAAMRHIVRFGIGDLYYMAEAGFILGKVPYPILEIPMGTEAGGYGLYNMNIPSETGSGGYSLHVYNMMKYMEYATDKYVDFHGELTTYGLITNKIPLIKHLNLREMFSFKVAYGSLSGSHRNIVDYPDFMEPLSKPYVEVGVGITNLLRLFSLQSVWRLTDTHKAGVHPWGVRLGLSLSF